MARETSLRPRKDPPSRSICARCARSGAVPKSPAWGATPPSATAFSSCTSPRTTRPRQGSFSVGAMRVEERGRRAVEAVLHPERARGPAGGPASSNGAPAHPLQDVAEQDDPEVAVDGLRAGLVGEVERHDPLEVRRLALDLLVERRPPQQPAGVREEVPHRDLLLGGAGERREEGVHAGVEVELPLVHQDHRQGRRDHDLGQAGEVVDRVGGDLGRARVVGEAAEGAQVDERPVAAHGEDARRGRPGRRPRPARPRRRRRALRGGSPEVRRSRMRSADTVPTAYLPAITAAAARPPRNQARRDGGSSRPRAHREPLARPPAGPRAPATTRSAKASLAEPPQVARRQGLVREEDDAARPGLARERHLLDDAGEVEAVRPDPRPDRRRRRPRARAPTRPGRWKSRLSGV